MVLWCMYRERGLGVSLFRLLSEHHPNSMVMLDEQYRMNRYVAKAVTVSNHRLTAEQIYSRISVFLFLLQKCLYTCTQAPYS